MRPLSAGEGYRYLLRSIVSGDGDRDLSVPLTSYYQQVGTPPGFWLGSGLPGLGAGDGSDVVAGDRVGEVQLQRLLGQGRDPVTGQGLGAPYPRFETFRERVAERVADLAPCLSAAERGEAVAAIEAAERARRTRRAVAGYDFTFSVPKSVSALWAVADAGTQALIAGAHHDAMAEVLDLMEREVAATRMGRHGIIQVPVRGLLATAFDHHDSRAGDPQLHTHMVVANKVQGPDGVWRALDGRPLHAATVALSEHYNAVLADRLTGVLGVGWRARDRGEDRNPSWEIAGVPDELIAGFSRRTAGIEAEVATLIADFVSAHGRRPGRRSLIRLRQQATLETRPDKQLRSLAELTIEWRQRAGAVLGQDAPTWARHVLTGLQPPGRRPGGRPVVLRADDLTVADLAEIAAGVVDVVSGRRSTWRRWNLYAEASRQTMGLRFASAADRERVVEQIVTTAQEASLVLTPTPPAATPTRFRREHGTSLFRPAHHVVFSSEQMLAAEDRLMAQARASDGPVLEMGDWGSDYGRRARMLGADQRTVVELIACSGRRLDVLVGPAGTGKTTTLAALRAAWEHAHGPGSVTGLAPSAGAAAVLAAELGIGCENTAKWLWEHTHGDWHFQPGQLVIIDEASLAGTLALDRIVSHAAQVGAKVLLVGDWAQQGAVEAGGGFGLIAGEIGAVDLVPELSDVRRMTQEWEKTASLILRRGDPASLSAYQRRDRIHGGDYDDVLERAYRAWAADRAAGRRSILVADTLAVVTDLNARARNDLILTGAVAAGGVRLVDGNHASVGDEVITRLNDRRLRTGSGSWVKNGDRWRVTAVGEDGSVTLRRSAGADGPLDGGRHRARPHPAGAGATVVLTADYVARHLDLGYAITVHRSQGGTVDVAHVLVASSAMTREALYVALTRGRQANHAWVATDTPTATDPESHRHGPEGPADALDVLADVLARSGRELSAHETLTAEREEWTSLAHLADQYEIIARAAQAERWTRLITTSSLRREQAEEVLASPSLAGLVDVLRHAEATGHVPAWLLDRAIANGHLAHAHDLAAVLAERVTSLARDPRPAGAAHHDHPGSGQHQHPLIAGLLAPATGPLPGDMNAALRELAALIEQRADDLLAHAGLDAAGWLTRLGPMPADPAAKATWMAAARMVAACADRHQLTPEELLTGDYPPRLRQDRIARRDLALAAAAARRARSIAGSESRPLAPPAMTRNPQRPALS